MAETVSVQHIRELVQQLSPAQQLELLQQVIYDMRASLEPAPTQPAEVWDEDELRELLSQPATPMNTRQIVELGLTGAWADEDITDGQKWVDDLRRARRERNQW